MLPEDDHPWKELQPSQPLARMGHAQKHLVNFQHIDPFLTERDVAKILEYVRQVAPEMGSVESTLHGGTLYKCAVRIGGKLILVHVVTSASGLIKTGFPERELGNEH